MGTQTNAYVILNIQNSLTQMQNMSYEEKGCVWGVQLFLSITS